jgi:signal transduction histidine kinase
MPAMGTTEGRLGRQYLLVALGFSVLLLASFALFTHLLVKQLSRSYLEDTLLTGRAQAEALASQLKGDGPLYKVVEERSRSIAQITTTLAQQDVVDRIQVFDDRGKIVYSARMEVTGFSGRFPEGNEELILPPTQQKTVVESKKNEYEIRVPVGKDIGTVLVAFSKPALEERVSVLRRQLILHTSMAGGSALVVLLGAVLFIWHLIKRNARLDQRRRLHEELATLGSLAANLAHEIRNPLNALSLNLEMLEEDACASGAAPETVGLARREVGRLSRLVNDFLVYARPGSPTLAPCSVRDVVTDVSALLAPECERAGVALRTEVEDLDANLDRAQLSQVLVNLALNSIQAMDGKVRRELILRGSGGENGESVVFEVLDNGPGIAEEDMSRVREAFFSRRKGGTGLGLAIAQRIVEAHGGSLDLANREEGGLRAVVRLPRNQG